VRLDGDDARGGAVQQLAVVADVQHRLRRLGQGRLEPALAGHVEVVVRLVEQQHGVRPAQQRLEGEPLLLPAGQVCSIRCWQRSNGTPSAAVVHTSHSTSAS
jgi:hypothetical protein